MHIKSVIEDNFLSPQDAELIQEILTGDDFPWYLGNTIAYTPKLSDLNKFNNNIDPRKNYYFIHNFYNDHKYLSHSIKIIEPILNKLNIRSLVRIKANLYPYTDTVTEHGFHFDQPYSLQGAVYYVNNNNGYTLLKNEPPVKSVMNRILFHDSSKEHSSTSCSDQKYRITININYF